jgi:hypothetical protein
MTTMNRFPLLLLPLLATAAAPAGDAPLYSNDFAKLAPGKLPDDQFLALAGDFAVKDVDGNRLVELAGTPLDSLGLLFGPTPDAPTGTVSARIWAATTGQRFPEFGVGANDAGGYKLWLLPRQKLIAIRKGDDTVATAPYAAWKNRTWTRLTLAVTKSGDAAWTIHGKAWPDGTPEPKDWIISYDEKAEPTPGRASVWANPYSGQPVRFDDFVVTR